MYEDIRRPTLLKPIPLLFIRSLSTIYYFSKFVQNGSPDKPKQLFTSNVDFLSESIGKLGNRLSQKTFLQTAEDLTALNSSPHNAIQDRLEKITIQLSEQCEKALPQTEQAYKELKMALIDLYKDSVQKVGVLVIDNNNEPQRVEKIVNTLKNFCFFDTDNVCYPSAEYSGKLTDTDFAFFTSTRPPQIHDLVKSLKTYRKPGLAITYIDKEDRLDEQAIRHGSQLQRSGFYVLYKVFTPIRLFTSIDKVYMKYHLQTDTVA